MRILGRRERIGCGRGIGGCLRHAIPGESFIRHIGNDKLIFDFKSGNGTTVKDRSRENNDGTFGTGAAAPTWKRNSLYFDGANYVLLTGMAHGITTGELTFCVALSNFTAEKFLFAQKTTYIEFYNSSNVIILLGKFISDTNTSSPYYLQVTRDNSGNLESYINGVTGNKGQSHALDLTYDGTSVISLGCYHNLISYFITTTMYSFRILNKCLSGIEAQNEYLVNKFAANN